MYKFLIVISIALFSSSLSANEIRYILTGEWFEQGVAQTNRKSLHKITDSFTERLVSESLSGFAVSEKVVFHTIGIEKFNKIGSVQSCNGLQRKCMVIDGYFKLYLPSDFDALKAQKWDWGGYKYSTNLTKKYAILGRELNITEILATCAKCNFDIARFEFDSEIGITSISLTGEGFALRYMLSSSIGLYAKAHTVKNPDKDKREP